MSFPDPTHLVTIQEAYELSSPDENPHALPISTARGSPGQLLLGETSATFATVLCNPSESLLSTQVDIDGRRRFSVEAYGSYWVHIESVPRFSGCGSSCPEAEGWLGTSRTFSCGGLFNRSTERWCIFPKYSRKGIFPFATSRQFVVFRKEDRITEWLENTKAVGVSAVARVHVDPFAVRTREDALALLAAVNRGSFPRALAIQLMEIACSRVVHIRDEPVFQRSCGFIPAGMLAPGSERTRITRCSALSATGSESVCDLWDSFADQDDEDSVDAVRTAKEAAMAAYCAKFENAGNPDCDCIRAFDVVSGGLTEPLRRLARDVSDRLADAGIGQPKQCWNRACTGASAYPVLRPRFEGGQSQCKVGAVCSMFVDAADGPGQISALSADQNCRVRGDDDGFEAESGVEDAMQSFTWTGLAGRSADGGLTLMIVGGGVVVLGLLVACIVLLRVTRPTAPGGGGGSEEGEEEEGEGG